jgi:hypothetical protein
MIAAVNTKETSIDTFIPLEARLLPFHRISLLLHPANRLGLSSTPDRIANFGRGQVATEAENLLV